MSTFRNDKLKEYRKNAGYTQLKFAEIIGVARTTYAEYEQGKIQPPLEKIQRICRVLNIQFTDLMDIENNTGVNIENLRTKWKMSNEEKIILVERIQKKERAYSMLLHAIQTIDEAPIKPDEMQAIVSVLTLVSKKYEPTPQDLDFMRRIQKANGGPVDIQYSNIMKARKSEYSD